ncbi:MAG: ATP-grasp domain-containing protein [Elusimicrobia bacterium]|nr:ATP-grasp domain-containing protein [Elusimicrobiota bacterium]
MGTVELSDSAAEISQSLKGKSILFVNSGFPRKKFILQRARQLGVHIVLLNKEPNWASRYADVLIQADTFDPEECVAELEAFLKSHPLHGAVTFWEDDIPLLAKICERFGWIGNSLEAALNARNKIRTRQILKSKELNHYSVPSHQIKSKENLKKASQTIGFPCVLKPAWGASSQFVVKVENWEEAEDAFEYIRSTLSPKFDPIYSYGTDILCEGYADGAEVDLDILLQDGQVRFSAVTDNFPTKEPFFIETGDAMPSRHEEADLKRVLEMGEAVVKALGLTHGAVHMEAKICLDSPKLIEVNARMGGDYIPDWIKTVWGVDLVEESLKIAVGMPVHPQKHTEPQAHLVGRYLIPSSSGVISGITSLNGHPDHTKVHETMLEKEIGDPVFVPPEGFDSLGWVVGKGNNYAEAEENLEETFKNLHISIARFDSTSSIGKTRRRNRFSSASIARKRILQSARLEHIRKINTQKLSNLHIGILCNRFEETTSNQEPTNESLVHQDLTSVGLNIKAALESKGHQVTFFDMNETPLPSEKMADGNVDIMFNVCERINNSSLLEPHAASILDCLGIPYTGSNPLTLALCIDKIKVKKILEYHQIPTPRFDYVFNKREPIREDLRYPLIVKPANTDNSIGITNDSVVTSPQALREQVEYLLEQFKRPVLVEEFIEGDEVDVSIMGNAEEVKVLPLSRSIFDDLPRGVWHIYPFKAKWTHDPTYEKIRVERPARYSQKLTALISEIALDVYNIFDCHDYARVEIRVDKDGNPFVLEINPNPSINRGDCVPNSAELIGLNYTDFIEEILRSAISRYQAHPPYYHLQSSLISL